MQKLGSGDHTVPFTPPLPSLPPGAQAAVAPKELEAPLEKVKFKPILGSPITQPAVATIEAANTVASPSRPLSEHAIDPKPFNIDDFMTNLNAAKTKNDADIKAYKKDITIVKTKKVALIALAVVGTLLLMTAIGAVCAFCPPAGAALLALGLGGVAIVGGAGFGAAYASIKGNFTKEEMQTFHQREDAIKQALTLLDQTPTHGKSFEEFLENCQKEGLGGPKFEIDHLKDYISIYEKEQKLDKMTSDVTEIRTQLKEDLKNLKELGVRPNETQTSPEKKFQDWQSAKALEKELSQTKDQLKNLGVKDPDNPQSANDRLGELQQKQVDLFKQRDHAPAEGKAELNKEIGANKKTIDELKRMIDGDIVGTIPHKQNQLDELQKKQFESSTSDQLPTIDQEIERLKNENIVGSINSPYVDVSHVNTSINLERIAQLEQISASIEAKHAKINEIINPNSVAIGRLEAKIKTEIETIKNLGIPNAENLPAIRQKIKDLTAHNKTLEAAVNSSPESYDESGLIRKELSTRTFNKNVKLINDLKTPLEKIDKHLEDIDNLYDKVTPTKEEIAADKRILFHKLNSISYDGPDLRKDNSHLKDWTNKTIIAQQGTVEFGPDKKDSAIGIFGTYNSSPRNGYYLENSEYHGVWLGYSKKGIEDMGRTNQNNFLSNFYAKEVTIEGESYPSTTHYLLLKKIDKDIASLEERGGDAADLKILNDLKNDILKVDPKGAYAIAMHSTKRGTLTMHPQYGLFVGMDKELKTALFHKFIGKDGMPTEEGEMLLKTGNKTLYAGNEKGNDLYFGMQFTDKGVMMGENRLGIAMMELRSLMKNSNGQPLV